jgi:hypothetical protein
MHPALQGLFDRFPGYECAIVGSAAADYDSAHDVDVLFLATVDFPQLCHEYGVKYGGWDSPAGQHVRLVKNFGRDACDKPVQLLQHTSVRKFEDHRASDGQAYALLLRDGTVLNPGKRFDKATAKPVSVTPAKLSVSSALTPDPLCCWCRAPVVLTEGVAWCSGSEACRERQRQCGMKTVVDGEERWLFVPTPSQTEVLEAKERNLFVYSNRGSGKSHVMRWACHMMALAIPGFRYAILRTSFPELMKNHLVFLKDEMKLFGEETDGISYNKTEHVCYYGNGSMGFYMQAETDEQVKNALGIEMYLCVFDEAPTFKWEHMTMIASSVRVPAKFGDLRAMVRYLGNPIGDSIEELWKYFVDKDVDPLEDPEYRADEWRAIQLRLEDNIHLDVAAYRKQFAGLPPHIRRAWLDGERADERAMFDFRPHKDGKPYHVVSEWPTDKYGHEIVQYSPDAGWKFPEWVKIYRAYDHGFYPDPAVCVWFAIIGKQIVVFKEKTWLRKVAKEIAGDILELSKGMRVSATYCDPTIDIKTGADIWTIRDIFENNGVPMDPSVNNREHYAHAIHSALQEEIEVGPGDKRPRIVFLNDGINGVPLAIKYIPLMRYDETKPLQMADHKHDHIPIAIAYMLLSVLPNTTPVDVGPQKKWLQPKTTPHRTLSYRR